MLYITSIAYIAKKKVKMKNTELDRIKTTITISLGAKNLLRALKGSMSYEDYIKLLLRKDSTKEIKSDTYIELQKFERVRAVYSEREYKIVFSYNKCNHSENFHFDISIDELRHKGAITSFDKYLNLNAKKNKLSLEYQTYFKLLEIAIQKEIDPLFKHKGRIEDQYSWENEFRILNLPKKSLEEDIVSKLNYFKGGYHYND